MPLAQTIRKFLHLPSSQGEGKVQTRANPVAPALAIATPPWGIGADWAQTPYGDYLAQNPTIYACVDLRARNLARVRIQAHRLTQDGDVSPLQADHQLQHLLDHPNPHWSRHRFWYMVEASLCLYGSAPIAIFRDDQGNPAELWWMHPSYFSAIPDPLNYIKGYLYMRNAEAFAFTPEDVIWLRYPNPLQEYAGLSPIAALRMTIDTSSDAIRFNRRFFQNDATPGRVYIKTDQDLTQTQAAELRDRWEASFKDQDLRHRIAVLDKSADLKTLGIPQRDMEFIEGQQLSLEHICGAYGISPILIGDLRRASMNNTNVAMAQFWTQTMATEMSLVESELDHVLLSPPPPGIDSGMLNPIYPGYPTAALDAGARPTADSILAGIGAAGFGPSGDSSQNQAAAKTPRRRYAFRFDQTQIGELREDALAKAQREQVLVASGLRTINELRQADGLKPVAWGDEKPAAFDPVRVGAPPPADDPASSPAGEGKAQEGTDA